MSELPARIAIAGGGMVGLSLALLLAGRLPENVGITLVERVEMPKPGSSPAGYHPSFDARSTALSYSTEHIYRDLGIWDRLAPGMEAIRAIHVSRRNRFGSSLLHSREQGWDALGWVVENPCLGQTLLAALAEQPRIDFRCPARVIQAQPRSRGLHLTLDSGTGGSKAQELTADLLVIADGAESQLREQLGFLSRRRSYGQHALIANLGFSRSLEGCAFERFTESGPLAVLPLPSLEPGEHRAALVWTLPGDRAEHLAASPEPEFARALGDAFGERLGAVRRVGHRQCYPLALTEALEQARRGMVVVGNAAHSLHPVAGQGFNLALRDLDCLARVLADAIAAGDSPGELSVLQRYLDRTRHDQAQTIFASDGLPGLFALSDPLIAISRDLALAGLDLLPAARRMFVRQAAGMAALEARGA